ncbi:glycosyltransferase [Candidatus Dependentiae bacterium]|nr:glycosyltransferase [Candidatus Dependentiae bacterium]
MNISVIMTNWNGQELLEKTVPLVKKSIDFDKDNNYRFIIVDDCSPKNDIEYIKKTFSYVEVIKTPVNSGFQGAVNYGITQTTDDLILIMNNDIYPKEEGFSLLSKHFKKNGDKGLFAVTGKFYNWDEKTFLYGNRGGKFEKGHIWLYEKNPEDTTTQTFFACGGCALWDRKRFLELGGFDLLYHPLYYEEIDISYRALKRGWKIIYEPSAIFYHRVQSTITVQHKQKKIRVISGANNYLFTWKNITDKDLFIQHILWCPILLLRDLFKLKFRFWFSIFRALKKIRDVSAKRKFEKIESKISDKEIFYMINCK